MPTDEFPGDIRIPSVYQTGYKKAAALNPELARMYAEHTVMDDPAADAVISSLASFDHQQIHRFINAGMEKDTETLAQAPQLLRDFFDDLEHSPAWFDPNAVLGGYKAFHDYSDLFIPAFFVATVQNATTLISKAFYETGRVASEFGPRRIRQNVRHFIEIMLPGALDRRGDGWKLSVRTRLIHAQIRRLIRESGEWDEAVYGTPLSAAHMALASANFSGTILRHAQTLGAKLDDDARAGFMQAWRYASWLIGSPEELLFEGDEAKTNEFSRIAHICEPPPGEESSFIANTLVKALPVIAGNVDASGGGGRQQSMVDYVYKVTRALLGDEISNDLGFPRHSTTGLLPVMRWYCRFHRLFRRLAPRIARKWRGKNFLFLLEASMLDDLSYRIPDHLKAEKATPW